MNFLQLILTRDKSLYRFVQKDTRNVSLECFVNYFCHFSALQWTRRSINRVTRCFDVLVKKTPPMSHPLVFECDIAANFREVVCWSILYQESLILTSVSVTVKKRNLQLCISCLRSRLMEHWVIRTPETGRLHLCLLQSESFFIPVLHSDNSEIRGVCITPL